MASLYEFNNATDCDDELARVLSKEMSTVLINQPKINMAIAGGNTPKALYQKLSHSHLPWGRVQITLTDERWVNVDHLDSNENMARQKLLRNQAVGASFIGLKSNVENVQEAVLSCDENIKSHMKKLDLVILGMGEDGHFASIFPNLDNLDSLLDLKETLYCQAVFPKDKPARMSLTMAYLLTARKIYLRISGDVKKNIILGILNNSLDKAYPIAELLKQSYSPIDIYWSL